MGIDLTKIISIGTQASELFAGAGSSKGGVVGLAGNAMKLYNQFKKYPHTMEGLQKALADYNIDGDIAKEALSKLSHEQREFIDKQLPGSLGILEQRVATHLGKSSGTTTQTDQVNQTNTSTKNSVSDLLERSKRLHK